MGVQGAHADIKQSCEDKQPGSAAKVFQRVEFEQAAEHFSKHDDTACFAATAYILPDLHTNPRLAEALFNKGCYDVMVGRVFSNLKKARTGRCKHAMVVWDGLSPAAKQAENGGGSDAIKRAWVSSLCMRALAKLLADPERAAQVPIIEQFIASGEGEAQAAALCRDHNWGLVDQDTDNFLLVIPAQSVTRFIDGDTALEIIHVGTLCATLGLSQDELIKLWAMRGYDLDRQGIPSVGQKSVLALLTGAGNDNDEIWDRYCKLGCRRPDFTKKQMLQKFAVAELFFRYPRVYSEAAGGLVPLCGSEPPAALVEAAGGKGAVDAICGIAVSDVWSTRLFKGGKMSGFWGRFSAIVAPLMPDVSGIVFNLKAIPLTVTQIEALMQYTAGEPSIGPRLKLPAILYRVPRHLLRVAHNWTWDVFHEFVQEVKAGGTGKLPSIVTAPTLKLLADVKGLADDVVLHNAIQTQEAAAHSRMRRSTAPWGEDEYGAAVTVREMVAAKDGPAMDVKDAMACLTRMRGVTIAAAQAAYEWVWKTMQEVAAGDAVELPADMTPDLLQCAAEASGDLALAKKLAESLANVCAATIIEPNNRMAWSLEKDIALVDLAQALVAGSADETTSLDALINATAAIPPVLQEFSRNALKTQLFSLMHLLAFTGEEMYPPLEPLARLVSASAARFRFAMPLRNWASSQDERLVDIAVELGRLPGHACLEVVNLPEELAGFTRKSIPARFFNHLLPRAQAAAAPDETAAITRLRKELPSLKEFNRPWSPKASEGVVDFAEECEARGTRVNFAAVRDYGARLASLARSDRAVVSHYFQLLWCARQPADAGDLPAVCRMRRLAPSLDVLPVATRRWTPEEDAIYLNVMKASPGYVLSGEQCRKGIAGLECFSASALMARQYAWRTAAKRLGDAEQPAAGLPAAVLEVRALLPNIREERPAVKDAWEAQELLAAGTYFAELAEAGEVFTKDAGTLETAKGMHGIAGLENRSRSGVRCHLQQRLLPLAAKALSEEGSGARGSEAVLAAERAAAVMLRAALLSAAARMGEPSLTLRVAEQILLPGRHATMPQFINDNRPELFKEDVEDPALPNDAINEIYSKYKRNGDPNGGRKCRTKAAKRQRLLEILEEDGPLKTTQAIVRAMAKGRITIKRGSSLAEIVEDVRAARPKISEAA